MSHKPMKWVAAVLALALVAGACSNDSSSKNGADAPKGDGKPAETAGGSMFSEDVLNKGVHEGTPKRGGTLTYGLESDVLTTVPYDKMIQPADVQLGSALYASLINFGEDGRPVRDNTDHKVNQLAQELKPSKDLKTWTLTLRDGLKFANGKDLTAKDVVAQTEHVMANSSTCSCQSEADNIESVTADGNTVVYELKEPNVAFDGALSRTGLGWIVDLDAMEDPAQPNPDELIGAGPFAFHSKSGDSYTVVANEHYFGIDPKNGDAELPYLDKIVFRPLSDSVTRLQAVQSGGVQIMQTADTSNLAGAKDDADLRIQPAEGSSATILVLNLTHPPFGISDDSADPSEVAKRSLDDPQAHKARAAFNYSIDRGEINQKYYKGTRSPAYGFIPKAMGDWYDPDPKAQLPRTDVDKAKKMIAELAADGVPTEIEALCINTPEATGIFEILKEQADEVGIDATLNQVEQAKLLEILLGGEDGVWDVACFRSPQIWDPNSVYNALHSGGTTNLPKYQNAKVDQLLNEARESSDQEKRKKLYDEIQVQVAEDIVYVPLLFDLFGNVYRSDVSGLSIPSPASLGIIEPETLYYIAD